MVFETCIENYRLETRTIQPQNPLLTLPLIDSSLIEMENRIPYGGIFTFTLLYNFPSPVRTRILEDDDIYNIGGLYRKGKYSGILCL